MEIVNFRHAVFLDLAEDRIYLLEVHLPVAPLDTENIAAEIDDDPFTAGLVRLAEEEVAHFDAVDDAVIRHLTAGNFRQGREKIHLVDDLVTGSPGGDLAGPSDCEGNSQAALEAGKEGAAPGAGGSLEAGLDRQGVGALGRLGSIVGGEDDDGVVAYAQVIDLVQNHPRIRVDLHQEISPGTIAGLTREIRVRHRGVVRRRIRNVEEEWLLRFHLPLHEVDRLLRNDFIDQRTEVQTVWPHRLWRLAPLRFHDKGGFLETALVEPLEVRVGCLVGRVGYSIPLIKTLVRGEAARGAPEVPFAEHAGGIAGVREHLGHGHFPLHEAIHAASLRSLCCAAADRIAAGHDR